MQAQTKAVISLTSTPDRFNYKLHNNYPMRDNISSLCLQNYKNYEVHLNIPKVYMAHNTESEIPKWLKKFESEYDHFKIFLEEDVGPPTKILPTLKRVQDPETMIVVVDDDFVYHQDLVLEHSKKQKEMIDTEYGESCIGYDGLQVSSAREGQFEKLFKLTGQDNTVRCVYVTRIGGEVSVRILQHYKSVSYKRKFFEDDFWEDFVGKTRSDDVLCSVYMAHKKIPRVVTCHQDYVDAEKGISDDEWRDLLAGEMGFPCVRTIPFLMGTGTTDEKNVEIQERFYFPEGWRSFLDNAP